MAVGIDRGHIMSVAHGLLGLAIACALWNVVAGILICIELGKRGVKVAEAAKLALAGGYKSASKQFGNIVSQALTTDKRFRKISRGVYALKGVEESAAKKVAKKAAKKEAAKKD